MKADDEANHTGGVDVDKAGDAITPCSGWSGSLIVSLTYVVCTRIFDLPKGFDKQQIGRSRDTN